MTHLTSGTADLVVPPSMLSRRTPRLDLQALQAGIADRGRRLLDLEAAMVTACEAEAARGRNAGVHMHDRETWDRATWQRYLDAATKLEPEYGPQLRRFYTEIDHLARLVALPLAA